MRRAIALALTAAFGAAAVHGAASAETWKKYTEADTGIAWSYDADYAYKDRATGRIVVMQAISKPSANLGPSGPGKPDGVGSVVALDCSAKNMIVIGSYSPSKPLALTPTWRSDAPKKATGADNEALFAAVCSSASKVPTK
jgi:hypothetical protein